ncbi:MULTISPECIES: CaiB/BaiF CoA transferase family protein [Nocardiopsis]|uniref:L-carnitine dehydratase/bile acid-inducible protein F n=1 Tax=Nocardiopsis dassonvillei (strain ATCC 23218 / DSM 43111 / CIP 107115 / JCM 7437 / KCTC 9190 / NBRC 14626 / NCTC 10488 / NRRL B-5397 / IMRU 509) TaxID=446468 RepID=D7B213_NOCDD|nr:MULTISPECIES: CaiB/BaiF CoA-transferase family protein [Nocardiopsis]ADH66634.1 L-carnitine dehydratase/bile acid-inducible protein F [Nocardiopsis dassonvillei subsp. dassonvillei DSM 43111]APC34943.1 CoA transferase [Nocardiopsis dassonvillei]NKY78945.1 CoA transferase [Nocardiopsis dassonvillei]VEI92656.1 Formyl-coenzyme A transferase [Nocardiopsis dassonvillei]
MQPLRGVTVVSLEQAIAAPYASRHLADMGARVIKVERPGTGDFARGYDSRVNGMSSHFVWVNRNKESLTLDIKDPRGNEVLRRLLARADVFIQNLAPGAAARAGLGAAELHARHPGLIVCDISGYGSPGPYETMKAYDLLVQSESGLLSVTGSGEEMAKVGISVSDIAAGMYAYSSILGALLERARTGKGAHLDVSMLEATAEWMGFPLYYTYDGQEPPARAGAAHATIYPYGPFVARDEQVVLMAIQNEREWRAFCERFLERPAFAEDPAYATNAARSANRDTLKAVIDRRFAELDGDEATSLLADVPVAYARVNSLADVWNHPQLAARGRWHEVDTPTGRVPALAPPGPRDPAPRMDPVPDLGEHTDAILGELGMTAEETGELRSGGVV